MLREDYMYARTTESSRVAESSVSGRPGQDSYSRQTYIPPLRSTSPKATQPSPHPAGLSGLSQPPPFPEAAGASPFSTPDYGFAQRLRPSTLSDRSTLSDAFGFLQYLEPQPQAPTPPPGNVGPVWQDGLVLSETHYHHGDHHHHHHQRHVHHFHDLHLLGSAEEILDLRNAPQPTTTIIPGSSVPQLKLRPDVLGRQAFEAGLETFFSSLSTRFDAISRGAPVPDPLLGRPLATPYDAPLAGSASQFSATAGSADATSAFSSQFSRGPLDPTGRLMPYSTFTSGLESSLLSQPLRRTPLTDAELREAERRAREAAAAATAGAGGTVETRETVEVRDDPSGDIQEVTTIVKTTRTVRQVNNVQDSVEERASVSSFNATAPAAPGEDTASVRSSHSR
eukprot:EG_transcript_9271